MGKLSEFSVTLYGKTTKITSTISKSRCRIFYKYENQNGGYITDEFSKKLISSLPYTPIKGIFEEDIDDFGGHSKKRTEGKIYGVVPENYNLEWEKHLDDDGVEREYATADVYLYTGIYKEATLIPEKGQSMELYRPTLKGEFKYINGKRLYMYTDGEFAGLQVLGDEVVPCFEGAAFYTLEEQLPMYFSKLEELNKEAMEAEDMDINFNLSDGKKYRLIWNQLNTNFNEDSNWTVDFDVFEVFDEYAIISEYSTGKHYRQYYTKDNENDTVTFGNKVETFFVDVTAAEKTALEAIKVINNDTFEALDENYNNVTVERDTFSTKVSELEIEKATLDGEINTLKTENSEFSAKIEEQGISISTLITERDNLQNNITALEQFKLEVERNEKKALIALYSNLPEEITANFEAQIDQYSYDDLKKELAVALVDNNPNLFSNQSGVSGQSNSYLPKDENTDSLVTYLEKYRIK